MPACVVCELLLVVVRVLTKGIKTRWLGYVGVAPGVGEIHARDPAVY